MVIQNDRHELSISTKLRPFIESLNVFINSYEKSILKISNTLPDLENRIDKKTHEAKAVLQCLFSQDSGTEIQSVKREIVMFHEQLDTVLDALKEMDAEDKKIFDELKKSIRTAIENISGISSVSEISESLKVYAINSIVNSQKAGIRGRGYQVISTEFIILSEQIAAISEKITNLIGHVEGKISSFIDVVNVLEDRKAQHVELISVDSEEILQNARTSMDTIAGTLGTIIDQIEMSKSPTYDIMIELQKQDIIHQQLIHLVENMNDILLILKNNSTKLDLSVEDMSASEIEENRSLYTLLIFLIENTENQMTRITEEFMQMVHALESMFSDMAESITRINHDTVEYSRLILDHHGFNDHVESGRVKSFSDVDRIFDFPKKMIHAIISNIGNVFDLKKDILSMLSIIESKIGEENAYAETFLPVVSKIRNLLLLSKIEQERHLLKFLFTESNRYFLDSFDQLSIIIPEVEKAHKMVYRNYKNTAQVFLDQEAQCGQLNSQFLHFIETLENTKKVFLKQFDAVMEITTELVSGIRDYTDHFNELRSLNDELRYNMNVCTDIKESIEQKIEKIGGALPIDQCTFKDIVYNNIVMKCTVAQERDTIKENFKDIVIEESVGSKITLF